jgi:dethiobiotin synthetase
MVLPLFAVLTYSLTSPLSVRLSVLKIALIEAAGVARYWQPHQQARTAIGASLNWKRTAPQKQRPLIGSVIGLTLVGDTCRDTSKLDSGVKLCDLKAMTAFFVTSTGTDIGKTYVGCGLLSHWRAKGRKVDAYKPLLSGFDPAQLVESDAGRLLTALGRPVNADTLDQVSPWRYTAAISADAAAAKEGKQVEYQAVLSASRAFLQGAHDVALIEGAGGIMAPLSDDRTMLDFAVDIQIPAILVVGSYLGTLSHSLTALSIMEARKVPVTLIIMNETVGSTVPLADNALALARRWPATPVRGLQRDASPQAIAAIAEFLYSG